jgi:hypothetical protein
VRCIHDPIFMLDPKIMGVECMSFYFYTNPKIMADHGSFHCMRANLDDIFISTACMQKIG